MKSRGLIGICSLMLLAQAISQAADMRYLLHVPKSVNVPKIPLLVMLHGCDETAEEFARVTRMNDIADREGFAVLYPEQSRERHKLGCWNWFAKPGAAVSNERAIISALIDEIQSQDRRLTGPTFVAGISAGGAMAGILSTCEPNRFRAGAIHSGVSFLRARDESSGLLLMIKGSEVTKVMPPGCPDFQRTNLLVIHGERDPVVHPSNVAAILQDLSLRDSLSGSLTISGLVHAWSGGTPGLKYSEPAGIDASRVIWGYF
jgi:poly(hydroxyalkanoate) depolymerase family esterase